MSIRIDNKKCIGCGKCLEVCPGNLLCRGNDGKSFIRKPEECWGCTSCLKECSSGAISFFLGADIGGQGTTLYTQKDDKYLHWHFIKPNDEEEIITIDKKESNNY